LNLETILNSLITPTLEKIHERALENSHKAAIRNEIRWNKKAKPEVFEEGEEVWVKDDTKKKSSEISLECA